MVFISLLCCDWHLTCRYDITTELTGGPTLYGRNAQKVQTNGLVIFDRFENGKLWFSLIMMFFTEGCFVNWCLREYVWRHIFHISTRWQTRFPPRNWQFLNDIKTNPIPHGLFNSDQNGGGTEMGQLPALYFRFSFLTFIHIWSKIQRWY